MTGPMTTMPHRFGTLCIVIRHELRMLIADRSLVLVLGVRPALLRRFEKPPLKLMNTEALPGKHALVLEEVGEHAGRVKLDGDVWTARPLDVSEVYPPGTTVTVMEIYGATAVVWRGP